MQCLFLYMHSPFSRMCIPTCESTRPAHRALFNGRFSLCSADSLTGAPDCTLHRLLQQQHRHYRFAVALLHNEQDTLWVLLCVYIEYLFFIFYFQYKYIYIYIHISLYSSHCTIVCILNAIIQLLSSSLPTHIPVSSITLHWIALRVISDIK